MCTLGIILKAALPERLSNASSDAKMLCLAPQTASRDSIAINHHLGEDNQQIHT